MMRRIITLIVLCIIWTSGHAFYKQTQSLPRPRQMHGAGVLGDFIYVIGGNTTDKGWENSVVKAPINLNGSIGKWSPTTPMPQPRAYIGNTTIVLNDVLYVIGGFDGEQYWKTIIWTKARPDGSLQRWQESRPLPGPGVDCSAAVATPGHIYLIGGATGSPARPVTNVWEAILDNNGNVVQWQQGPSLPVPLWFHNVAVVSGKLWVWAGLTTGKNDSVNPYVYSAPLRADGSIGMWDREMITMPEPMYSAAGSACGSYLISFCGRYKGGAEHSDIWYTALTGGGIGQWQKLQSKLYLRVYHTVATDFRRGLIYLPGGRYARDDVASLRPEVFYLKLAESATQKKGTPTTGDQVAKTETMRQEQTTQSRMNTLYQSSSLPQDSLPGFIPYEQARQLNMQRHLPVVIYFHSPRTKSCQRQREQVANFNFAGYQGRVAFAWVDTTILPQLVQQMGVFRVPTWLFFDKGGNKRSFKIGVISPEELTQQVSGLE
jgi:hypothetical protein